MQTTDRVFEILLIDDNPGDVRLMELALSQCDVRTHVSVLHDSRDATLYLRSKDKIDGNQRPDLILLDYKMPLDGGIALAEIKGDPYFQCIPILVMTGCTGPKDIDEVYRRHANACFKKPMDLEGLQTLTCSITRHWLGEMLLPPAQWQPRVQE